jgi:hypothetical protein
VRFWAFLGKGSSKTPRKYTFLSPCRNLFPKNRQKLRCQFSLDFLFYFLSRFQVLLGNGNSKALQKKIAKSRVEVFAIRESTIDKKSKTDFSRFLLSRFWAFLSEGVQKRHLKKKLILVLLLWPLTHPPPTFFVGPFQLAARVACCSPAVTLSAAPAEPTAFIYSL